MNPRQVHSGGDEIFTCRNNHYGLLIYRYGRGVCLRPQEIKRIKKVNMALYQDARKVKPVKILGSTVNMVDVDFTVSWIEACIRQRRSGHPFCEKSAATQQGRACCEPLPAGARQLLVTGFHGLNQAHRNPDYFRIGAECDLWVPDSIAPVLIAKRRGMKGVVRTPGADITREFLRRADKKGYASFFYGDSQQTLDALRARLERDYPGHRIAGMISPPFRALTPEEEQAHIDEINAAQPDVVWVGLGLPKQDEWVYRCKGRLNAPVAAGIGAAFGFLAGTSARAPRWVQSLNLEWAYMMVKKPKRTGRRVLVEGSQFIWSVLREEFGRAAGFSRL